MGTLRIGIAVAALAVAAPGLPAFAQERGCTAEIDAAQRYMMDQGNLSDDESNHVQTILAEAGAANQAGEPARCLEFVQRARDELGMRE